MPEQGNQYRNYVAGLVSGTGTLELIYQQDKTGAGSNPSQSKAHLMTDGFIGSKTRPVAKVKLYVYDQSGHANSGERQSIETDIIITNVDMGITVGELTTFSVGFQTTGEVRFNQTT